MASGHGGARAGAGRKPKADALKALHGSRTTAKATPALPPVDEFAAPDDLTTDERQVWLRLAPSAFAARTLTRASEYEFVLLCKDIVLERVLRVDPAEMGKSNWRGVRRSVRDGLMRFCLAPLGKPLVVGSAPIAADPFAEFDDGASVN